MIEDLGYAPLWKSLFIMSVLFCSFLLNKHFNNKYSGSYFAVELFCLTFGAACAIFPVLYLFDWVVSP